MATWAGLYFIQLEGGNNTFLGIAAFVVILLIGVGAVPVDLVVRNKQITSISAVYFGLLVGLLLGALFSMALEPFLRDYEPLKALAQPLRLFITLVCCYVTVSTLLQTKDEFRFIIPY